MIIKALSLLVLIHCSTRRISISEVEGSPNTKPQREIGRRLEIQTPARILNPALAEPSPRNTTNITSPIFPPPTLSSSSRIRSGAAESGSVPSPKKSKSKPDPLDAIALPSSNTTITKILSSKSGPNGTGLVVEEIDTANMGRSISSHSTGYENATADAYASKQDMDELMAALKEAGITET